MPITGPSSYPPTMALFSTHWLEVNTELGAGGPLVLPGGTTQAAFSALRDDLVAFAASIQAQINDREIARGTINAAKADLVGRLGEFNRKVRGVLGHTSYAQALPDVPKLLAGEAATLAPLDDMASLWATINAATIPGFTGPLLLLGGYAIATFQTALAGLKAAYLDYKEAEQLLRLEREQRNDVQDAAYASMKAYRLAVQASFAPEHALVASLPAITPAGGHTPDAVTLSGEWDVPQLAAHLTWTASSDEQLANYQVRMTPGPAYDTDADTVVATLLPAALAHFTHAGLVNPGDVASYKVYVILTTGNEAGSNSVTVTWPV
jgi:hypothetical protein